MFLIGATGLAGCDQFPALQTAPSPLPTDKVGVLGITCPSSIIRQSMSLADSPIAVAFAPPLTVGGQAPVTTGCTRESGSAFPVGTTDVSCTTADSLGQTAACAFSIVVRPAPRLRATRFLAFGDSLTAGVVSDPFVFGTLNPLEAYPLKLAQKLAREFPLQTSVVVNVGLPGELAAVAPGRFSVEFGRVRPEVVLLMDGSNDVLDGAVAVPAAIAGLETMVMMAQAGGAEVLLATIPPVRADPERDPGAITAPLLNTEIRALAFRLGVTLVDTFAAFGEATCPPTLSFGVTRVSDGTSCIGDDHLHPTPAGYDVLAETFRQAIVETFGVNVDPSPTTMRRTGTRRRAARIGVRSSSPW